MSVDEWQRWVAVLEFHHVVSSTTKHIYEQHIKPLSRQQQVKLLHLLRDKLENGDMNRRVRNRTQAESLVEQHIAESQQQIADGQFFGPFSSAEEAIESLHKNAKTRRKSPKKKPR